MPKLDEYIPKSGKYYNEMDAVVNVIENFTGGYRCINTDHAYIHEGIGFKANFYIASLAGSGTVSFLFQTPEELYVHFKNLQISGLGSTVKVEIIRGTEDDPLVIDSAGVAATELLSQANLNDNSATDSEVVITKTPTYVTSQDGAVWDVLIMPGDTSANRPSVASITSNDNVEAVMKPDSPYVIKLTNLTATAATQIYFSAFWYEEAMG
jgi:hypothetical protein